MAEIVAAGLGVRVAERWLFRELDLTVESGECVALTGANGIGKSTLLRCVYGTQPVSEGQVLVAGVVPDETSVAFRRAVSVKLDDSELFAELSPRQHIDLLLGSFGRPATPADVQELLEYAGLGVCADVAAAALSAGQRQRLLLLGAIARPHDVLLLDEPERALDAGARGWVAELVRQCTAEGVAVVVATHDPNLRAAIADRTVELT
ncbi:ABC transporter ATP-binding protein [Crossiella cryophila]|uniref:ABC-type multidrug transport system ATPase subunit n=1 Tax=Crossiella cryophila TaxID=43355 RepID=A0A7W7C6Z3_9PSEU|nr:ATP-binding cassette domain-containing protein [Crossiella cryophila]MBB4675641.1 ABC-type multidrug transport system ATPase subunit [Crossiella cryophila]